MVLLSLTAPSSKVENPTEVMGLTQNLFPGESVESSDAAGAPSPGAGSSGSPAAELEQPGISAGDGTATSGEAGASPSSKHIADFAGGDFTIQCWPSMSVAPGRSTTIDCNILLANGYSDEISLGCRVEGMRCSLSPDRIQAVPKVNAMTTKLTVTAPASVPVGTRLVSVSATAGETGAALRQAEMNVDVPPPFSVSCESVGASFVRGAPAKVKCWVTFVDGFGEDVALSIKNGGGLPVTLDTVALAAAPNQTRSFGLHLNTENLQNGVYVVHLGAASPRYNQETSAVFQVVPAP